MKRTDPKGLVTIGNRGSSTINMCCMCDGLQLNCPAAEGVWSNGRCQETWSPLYNVFPVEKKNLVFKLNASTTDCRHEELILNVLVYDSWSFIIACLSETHSGQGIAAILLASLAAMSLQLASSGEMWVQIQTHWDCLPWWLCRKQQEIGDLVRDHSKEKIQHIYM